MHILKGPLSAFENGTAMECRRRSPSVETTHGGRKYIPFVKGGLGVLPQENFLIQYVCKSDSNTF